MFEIFVWMFEILKTGPYPCPYPPPPQSYGAFRGHFKDSNLQIFKPSLCLFSTCISEFKHSNAPLFAWMFEILKTGPYPRPYPPPSQSYGAFRGHFKSFEIFKHSNLFFSCLYVLYVFQHSNARVFEFRIQFWINRPLPLPPRSPLWIIRCL
jgi:hypothetical protein